MSKKPNFFLILLVLLFTACYIVSPVSLFAGSGRALPKLQQQQASSQPSLLNSYLPFEFLDREKGLSSDSVMSILQDSEGFLWIGTEDGLNRYDGGKFEIFRHGTASSLDLSGNTITTIFEDSQKRLWLGTYPAGLSYFDKDRRFFKNFDDDKLKKDNGESAFINQIIECKHSRLWLATNHGLIEFDPNSGKFTRHVPTDKKEDTNVFSLFEDNKGLLWTATENGLWLFDTSINKFSRLSRHPELAANRISCLLESPSGQLFLEQRDRLYSLDFSTWQLKSYPIPTPSIGISKDYRATKMLLSDNSTLWLGMSGKGLFQFDIKSETFKVFQPDPKNPNSLKSLLITALFQDRSGVLWIGDATSGLSKFSPYRNKFRLYKHDPFNENSLSSNYIRGIFEDSSGIIWIATQLQPGGLNSFDRKTGKFTRYLSNPNSSTSLLSNEVWAVYEDHKGLLWVGTHNGGLQILNRKTGTFTQKPIVNQDMIAVNAINVIYEDSRNNLWIGSETGIYKLSPDRNIVTSLDSELLLDINGIGRSVQSIYEDRFSNIWIGTNSGMLRYDPETKTVTNYFSVFNNLPQDHICSFMEDSRGLLWIATKNSGIHYFDRKTNTFGHVSEKDGLAHNNTYGIFEDKEGYLWISSDKGIVKYDHSRKIFKTFGIGDGLQGNEFNRRAFLQAKNGEIFFGGTKGLNSFFPEQIKGNSIEPPVIITSFKTSVDKEPIRVSTEKTVELSHQQNSVRFEFVALDFNAPEQNLYAYKLDGFDNDWIYSKNMHEAIYPNLSWGSYIFRVKATNSDGKWNEVGTTLRFSISPPPWRTWWAYLLYLLLTLLVLYQVFQFQTRKLKTEARIQQAVLRAEVAEAERKIAEAQAKASEMQAQVLERENLQRSQAEAEIKQKNQQLERANLKLQELDQIKATFTAMLVHDLKNPLTVVKGTLELLKENLGKENKIFNNMLNLSEKSLDKMLVMINEVLEFYRSDSHEIKLEREVINSELFLRNISEAARIAALTNSINVTLFIKDSLLDIEGDTQKLERAFSNIISNAIKFTPVGGNITIEASSSQLPTPMVSVCITDSGEGIPPEAIPHLFEPYKQASSSQKKKGVGLGLAIVKKIVTAHQGNISVQSQVGAGSSFTITLPAVAQRQARLVFQESTTGHDIVEVANDKSRLDIKLLIAEDNPTNVKIMQMQLRRLGYEAQFVENGQQAVEAFKNSSYSLILMDCHMPEMDGTEATVLIRQIEKEGRTPIIALTASTSDTKAEECFRAGMDDILAKPFKMEELKKIIERWGTVKENLPS